MNEQKDSQTIQGAGKVFAEGREALDLTREQTADILNLSVRMVRALEESKPDQLPERVYVNGYIRSYAKLLGLASQPLIDAWWAQHSVQAEDPATAEPVLDRASGEKPLRPLKVGRWAALALVLSAGFVYFVTGSDQGDVEENASGIPQPVVATEVEERVDAPDDLRDATAVEDAVSEKEGVVAAAVEGGVEIQAAEAGLESAMIAGLDGAGDKVRAATERPQETEEAVELAGGFEIEEPADSQLSARQSPQELSDEQQAGSDLVDDLTDGVDQIAEFAESPEDTVVAERELATAYALPRLTALGDDEIKLSFASDCWFELRDETGVLLYADLGRAGQARRYVGAGPFRVKLGYSPGVTVIFNGSEVDLQPFTRKDVANLTLEANAQPGNVSEPDPST